MVCFTEDSCSGILVTDVPPPYCDEVAWNNPIHPVYYIDTKTLNMEYEKALAIAEEALEQLRPHCYRCEIAGSIRRKKPEVKDIDLVVIPKPFDIGLLESGIASVVNRWGFVKGNLQTYTGKAELPCKYTQRILPEGIAIDLFFANKLNWGYIYALRTGSLNHNLRVLVNGWEKQGYKSVDGFLTKDGKVVEVGEEQDLFKIIGIPYVKPEHRR